MKLEKVWIVRDVFPCESLDEMIYEAAVSGLDRYIRGCPDDAWSRENHAIFSSRESAEAEARSRCERAAERFAKLARAKLRR